MGQDKLVHELYSGPQTLLAVQGRVWGPDQTTWTCVCKTKIIYLAYKHKYMLCSTPPLYFL